MVRTLSAATAFSRIVDDLGVLPYVSTLPAGSVRAGTLVRMLQLLHGDPAASSSWAELCRLIEHILADREMETSSLYAGGNQAVRIMNLHKAKGLEAPVVFLACPCGESDYDATQYIDRSADPAAGYFTISKSIGEFKTEVIAQPLGWGEMNERERAFFQCRERSVTLCRGYTPEADARYKLVSRSTGEVPLDTARRWDGSRTRTCCAGDEAREEDGVDRGAGVAKCRGSSKDEAECD